MGLGVGVREGGREVKGVVVSQWCSWLLTQRCLTPDAPLSGKEKKKIHSPTFLKVSADTPASQAVSL